MKKWEYALFGVLFSGLAVSGTHVYAIHIIGGKKYNHYIDEVVAKYDSNRNKRLEPKEFSVLLKDLGKYAKDMENYEKLGSIHSYESVELMPNHDDWTGIEDRSIVLGRAGKDFGVALGRNDLEYLLNTKLPD